MNAIVDAGYPYEIAGLVYYVFFLYMIRKRGGPVYAQRTRVLTILAAIGFVSVVPLHAARNPLAIVVISLLGLAAVACAFVDARRS